MIEALILIVIVAVAVCYLLRRFMAAIRAEHPACGLDSCENCPAARREGSGQRETDA
ncbi:MAG: hypothetical protein ACLFRF_05320 [Desulfobacterales bacterium]